MPHDANTGGFYVALLERTDVAIDAVERVEQEGAALPPNMSFEYIFSFAHLKKT